MSYTLYLGDCLEIMPTLADGSVDAVITDPPYGMSYQSARRTDTSKRKPRLTNDNKPFIWWLCQAYRVTKQEGALLCFCDWKHQEIFRLAIECAGYTIKSHVIWDRDWHGLGDLCGAFAPQHDIIWYATKGKFEFPNGRPKSVIRYRRLAAEELEHPTEKPIKLMQHLVESTTRTDGIVLDPMMGSGTTGKACQNTGRRFIGIEKEPKYYAIACNRLAEVAQ